MIFTNIMYLVSPQATSLRSKTVSVRDKQKVDVFLGSKDFSLESGQKDVMTY